MMIKYKRESEEENLIIKKKGCQVFAHQKLTSL